MIIGNGLISDCERFGELTDSASVLNVVEERFRTLGASHFLATGLPLPGRPIEPLILRSAWGESRGERVHIDPNDPVLRVALRSRRAFTWFGTDDPENSKESLLLSLSGPAGAVKLIGVPIVAFPPYQACVLAAGIELAADLKTMLAIDYFCTEAFRRLLEIGHLHRERPGDLSARERKVIALSAMGKTASEIAEELKISQRTVHAHLQNASEKLRASNKTHTVVEALRYGQISV
jgi:LuxR family quorum sensing-dependent transcriptional regulator